MFTENQIKEINQRLGGETPQNIIDWALENLPGLFQTTAFGLSGLVILDMVDKSALPNVDLIFIDTLYNFSETLALVDEVKERYPNSKLHVYRPAKCTNRSDFECEYGQRLWETNELYYDYVAKVEPLELAYAELGVAAVFTGRRRSQGMARAELPVLELVDGVLKVNPLANWTFDEVRGYISEHSIPYNKLLDKGYRSVGDYHSTLPVGEGEDERGGRWKGKPKTECGIHQASKYAEFRS